VKQDRNNREPRFDHHPVLLHLAVSINPSLREGNLGYNYQQFPAVIGEECGKMRQE